jgi:hypothetical protein
VTAGAGERHPIVLTISNPAFADRPFHAEPITIGVPFPQGLVHDVEGIGLEHDGDAVPVQAQTTELWPDGSVRWALVDFQATAKVLSGRYQLVTEGAASVSAVPRLTISHAAGRIVVDTGAARFELGRGVSFPFAAVTVDGAAALDPSATSLRCTNLRGGSEPARIVRVEVEETGALRSSLRLDAIVGPRRSPTLEIIARVHFFAGSSAVRLAQSAPRGARRRFLGAG